MNDYIQNDHWLNTTKPYSFNNIESLKIEPEFLYDNFISEHLLNITYNNQTLTLENNPFTYAEKQNNLSFIKESNILLGIQVIFNYDQLTSSEQATYQMMQEFVYDSVDQIKNKTQNNYANSLPIKDQWKDFIANESKILIIYLFNNYKNLILNLFRWKSDIFISCCMELLSSKIICTR